LISFTSARKQNEQRERRIDNGETSFSAGDAAAFHLPAARPEIRVAVSGSPAHCASCFPSPASPQSRTHWRCACRASVGKRVRSVPGPLIAFAVSLGPGLGFLRPSRAALIRFSRDPAGRGGSRAGEWRQAWAEKRSSPAEAFSSPLQFSNLFLR